MGGPDLAKLKDLKASDVKVTENGDQATAEIPGVPTPWTLVRVDGAWKLEYASLTGGQGASMGPMLASIGQAMDEITAQVRAGTLANTQAVMQALVMKMTQLGGGPGGPK
jgi:hypothetical protein